MIRTRHSHLDVAAGSHAGMTGKTNEDRFAVTAFRVSRFVPTPVLLAVLADGIGGHRGGEVAAAMAVEIISREVEKSRGKHPGGILASAVQSASAFIRTRAQEDAALQGMGTTVACAWVTGNHLYTLNVGDSRIYLLRKASIRQLSTDHTWLREALENGVIHPEEVENHPNSHIIRQFLGSPNPPVPATQPEAGQPGIPLLAGDLVLLTSDGLTDLVSDEEILAAFQARPAHQAVDDLIELANQRGGRDNITLVALKVPKSAVKGGRKWLRLGCLAGFLLALLVSALIIWGSLDLRKPVSTTPTLPPPTPTLLPPVELATPLPDTPAPTLTLLPGRNTPASLPTFTPWPTNTRTSP